MDAQAAARALLNEPEHFIKHYPLKCSGTAAPNQNVANMAAYVLVKQIGKEEDDKPGHRGATRPGLFGHTRAISSFWLQPNGGGGVPVAFAQAHVVPMVNYDGDKFGCLNLGAKIANMPYYILDGNGDGLMVTGELSGCCFVWLQQGNALWCIHVQPVEGISGVELQSKLKATGRFQGQPDDALTTYGRDQYPGGRASIVGVRRAGIWKLYAQHSNDGFGTITGAWQIHPGLPTRL